MNEHQRLAGEVLRLAKTFAEGCGNTAPFGKAPQECPGCAEDFVARVKVVMTEPKKCPRTEPCQHARVRAVTRTTTTPSGNKLLDPGLVCRDCGIDMPPPCEWPGCTEDASRSTGKPEGKFANFAGRFVCREHFAIIDGTPSADAAPEDPVTVDDDPVPDRMSPEWPMLRPILTPKEEFLLKHYGTGAGRAKGNPPFAEKAARSTDDRRPQGELKETVMTLEEFYDNTDRETWQGTITAFRNGAKFRLLSLDAAESGYTARWDFREAWKRGYDAMEAHLSGGGVITDKAVSIRTAGQLRLFALVDGIATEVTSQGYSIGDRRRRLADPEPRCRYCQRKGCICLEKERPA